MDTPILADFGSCLNFKCAQNSVRYLEKHPEAKEKLDKVLGEMGAEYSNFYSILLSGSANAFIILTQEVAPFVMTQVIQSVIVTLSATTNGLAGYLIASRLVGMLVPFLNIIATTWLVLDISGPAYRKIVPSVCEIALLRTLDNDRGVKGNYSEIHTIFA